MIEEINELQKMLLKRMNSDTRTHDSKTTKSLEFWCMHLEIIVGHLERGDYQAAATDLIQVLRSKYKISHCIRKSKDESADAVHKLKKYVKSKWHAIIGRIKSGLLPISEKE